jgi:hypothetical protein
MSKVGAVAENFHEGSRSEYLAQYVFASFGTAVAVPHQEDAGVDLHCTLTERRGQLAWPRGHYTLQVKSTMEPWRFDVEDSVRWFIEHPLPLFLCVIDKKQASIRIYNTYVRFALWAEQRTLPALELLPTDETVGRMPQRETATRYSLGAPIIHRTLTDLLEASVFERTKATLAAWIEVEQENLTRIRTGVFRFSMPVYETNDPPALRDRYHYSGYVGDVSRASAHAGETAGWLVTSFLKNGDLIGAALCAMLERHLVPDAPPMSFNQFYLNQVLAGPVTPGDAKEPVHELRRLEPWGADRLIEALKDFLAREWPLSPSASADATGGDNAPRGNNS